VVIFSLSTHKFWYKQLTAKYNLETDFYVTKGYFQPTVKPVYEDFSKTNETQCTVSIKLKEKNTFINKQIVRKHKK